MRVELKELAAAVRAQTDRVARAAD
jgi:hypothetical protein